MIVGQLIQTIKDYVNEFFRKHFTTFGKYFSPLFQMGEKGVTCCKINPIAS
jgi:hypothetical protein